MPLRRTELLPRKDHVRDAWLCVIAAEGANTEKQYFRMFQSRRVKVEVLSAGEDNKSSPQHVFDRLNLFKEQYDLGEQDQLWLMIDTDRWPPRNIAAVCGEAKKMKIGLAVSNPCFELWLLLHHTEAEDSDMDCEAVIKRIRAQVGSHSKHKLATENYRPHVEQAILRAKALDTNPEELWPSFPGTHVYKVVAALPRPD